MGKVSVRLSEFRENIPKNAQWLLLGAAFVIVLILLTLLVSGKKSVETQIQKNHGVAAELKITPDIINWADECLHVNGKGGWGTRHLLPL